MTYIKAYDEIRTLYSDLPLARTRGLKPSHFSFNVEGGRCEVCQGEGMITVEMQFMANIHLKCEHCKGKDLNPRFWKLNIAANPSLIFSISPWMKP